MHDKAAVLMRFLHFMWQGVATTSRDKAINSKSPVFIDLLKVNNFHRIVVCLHAEEGSALTNSPFIFFSVLSRYGENM